MRIKNFNPSQIIHNHLLFFLIRNIIQATIQKYGWINIKFILLF